MEGSTLAAVPPLETDEPEEGVGVGQRTETDEVTDNDVEAVADVEADEAPKPKPPMQESLPGDFGVSSTEFGGRVPDSSEIRLLGGKMPIEGSFAKGTVLDLHVRVKVTGVLGQDTVDAWGTEQATTRRHMAHMLSVKRID